jgi:hypothetical protein
VGGTWQRVTGGKAILDRASAGDEPRTYPADTSLTDSRQIHSHCTFGYSLSRR